MKETIGGNLTRYRKGLGLSQEALAEKVGVTIERIENYENAKILPDSKTLSALARALDVTLDNLLRSQSFGDATSSSMELPDFRFRAHGSFKENPQFTARVRRMLETYNAIEAAVGVPPFAPETLSCDRLEGKEKLIQATATRFRGSFGLGDIAVPNLFQAVEKLGLKVLRQPIEIRGFFGISACSLARGAFVIVNTHDITIERQLFTLAHELGHLIFHRDEYGDNLMKKGSKEAEKAREKVADYFASHLLIPQTEFDLVYQYDRNILQLKQHFRVSYQVILTRLAEMGAIDYQQEINKIRAIYKNRHGSPLKNSMELPPALKAEDFPENQRYRQLIWQVLDKGKISELKAAELLNLTVEELRILRQEAEVYAIS
ncbi:MAG: ImmA/IrrE family metallo-endopeptidase [Hormoscilla sp. GM7CHS1pb]|nr:ImmA/IrrE family metallo-endopeptidase [Hormoscilla sp. GM7CHS1pb]